MTTDNDKENKSVTKIPGVVGPTGGRTSFYQPNRFGLAGSSGVTWTHQAKPVGVLGAGVALADTIEGGVLNFPAYFNMQNKLGDIEEALSKMRKEFVEKTTALGEAKEDIKKRKELEKRYIRLHCCPVNFYL